MEGDQQSQLIVKALMLDLSDRSGFGNVLDSMEQEDKDVMESKWAYMIQRIIKNTSGVSPSG